MESTQLYYRITSSSTQKSDLCQTLVLLHGRGSDENDLLDLMSSFNPQMLIVSVRAPFDFIYGGYTWFELNPNGDINIEQLLFSRNLIVECVNNLQNKYPIDPSRLFLFGFSMGAMMSLAISLLNPEKYRGVIAHSGLLPENKNLIYQWDSLKNTAFFLAHGTEDAIVPVEFSRQAYKKLLSANADCTYHEYPIPHTISEESIGDIIKWLNARM